MINIITILFSLAENYEAKNNPKGIHICYFDTNVC